MNMPSILHRGNGNFSAICSPLRYRESRTPRKSVLPQHRPAVFYLIRKYQNSPRTGAGIGDVFSFKLNVLPTFGLDSWKSYILPVIAMGGYSVSYLARLMRSSLLEVMGQDYIRTARAKGLTEFAVVTKHALRNALIPVITVLGPTVAGLLTGSFVVEKIFAIPGIGYYFVNSVTQRDYTTIMGVTIFFAAFLMAMVLLVDIFYCLIDPRIKFDA